MRSKYIERDFASISPVCFSQEVQDEKLGLFSFKYRVEHMTVEDYAMRNLQKIRSSASFNGLRAFAKMAFETKG